MIQTLAAEQLGQAIGCALLCLCPLAILIAIAIAVARSRGAGTPVGTPARRDGHLRRTATGDPGRAAAGTR